MAENGNPNELSERQRRAIAALLSARNVSEAAQAAQVGERTLRRWLAEPTFRAALTGAEGQAIDAATRRLVSLTDSAIDVLTTVMQDPDAPSGVRLRAAQGVLDNLLRLRELRNVEERLTRLEGLIDAVIE